MSMSHPSSGLTSTFAMASSSLSALLRCCGDNKTHQGMPEGFNTNQQTIPIGAVCQSVVCTLSWRGFVFLPHPKLVEIPLPASMTEPVMHSHAVDISLHTQTGMPRRDTCAEWDDADGRRRIQVQLPCRRKQPRHRAIAAGRHQAQVPAVQEHHGVNRRGQEHWLCAVIIAPSMSVHVSPATQS